MTLSKTAAWVGLALVFFIPVTVVAADAAPGSFVLTRDQQASGNIIKAGGVIVIDGSVEGDVIVAGNSITITGPVAGDVIAAGNSITISGSVGGSVRVIGSNIAITGDVARNVWAMGSTVQIGKDTSIGWDLTALGATTQLDGEVKGNAWFSSASAIVSGKVNKQLSFQGDTGSRLVLLPTATVAGDVVYTTPAAEQLERQEGSTVSGKVHFTQAQAKHQTGSSFYAMLGFMKIVWFFSALVIGLIAVSLVPKAVLELAHEATTRPWQSLGIGLGVLVAVPIVAILLAFTLIGFPAALIGLAVLGVGLYVSRIVIGFALGLWLLNRWSKSQKYSGNLIWPMVVGLLVLGCIHLVPILGWIVGVGLCWIGLGATASWSWKGIKTWQ